MKKLLSLLLAICLMCVPIQTIHAQEPVDIIYDIINKDDHKKSGLDLINSIIGKDSKVEKENIKVIKNKRELDKKIKQTKKKDKKNYYYYIYHYYCINWCWNSYQKLS